MCSDKVSDFGSSGYVRYDPNASDYASKVSTDSESESASEISETLSTLSLNSGHRPSSMQSVQGDARLEMAQPKPLGAYRGSTLTADDWKQLERMGLSREYEPPPSEEYRNRLRETLRSTPGRVDRPLRLGVPMPNGHTADWTPTLKTLGARLEGYVQASKWSYRAQVEQQVQDKINRGAELAKGLVSLTAIRPMDERDVTDLMWFLQARGEVKTGTNDAPDITYTLPDPHGYIRTSLDNTSSTMQGSLPYQRASSHLEGGFQELGGSAAPRGINLIADKTDLEAGNLDRVLPNGKETILYQRMGAGVNGYPSERIFIKPEDHGMYMFNPRHGTDPSGPARKSLPHDKRHGIGHVSSTVPSYFRQHFGNNSPEGSFKERVPPALIKEYESLVAAAPALIKTMLQQNHPEGKSSGVHVMRTNVEAARNALLQNSANTQFHTALNDFWGKYLDGSKALYDHPEMRVGQEIILQPDEL